MQFSSEINTLWPRYRLEKNGRAFLIISDNPSCLGWRPYLGVWYKEIPAVLRRPSGYKTKDHYLFWRAIKQGPINSMIGMSTAFTDRTLLQHDKISIRKSLCYTFIGYSHHHPRPLKLCPWTSKAKASIQPIYLLQLQLKPHNHYTDRKERKIKYIYRP